MPPVQNDNKKLKTLPTESANFRSYLGQRPLFVKPRYPEPADEVLKKDRHEKKNSILLAGNK